MWSSTLKHNENDKLMLRLYRLTSVVCYSTSLSMMIMRPVIRSSDRDTQLDNFIGLSGLDRKLWESVQFISYLVHLVKITPILFIQVIHSRIQICRSSFRLFIPSIYCLTYDILTVNSFSSAENLVRDIYYDYIETTTLMTRTPLLIFVECQLSLNSSICELKIGIGFSRWLTAMSVSSKHNGKGLRICFNYPLFFCS